MGTVLYENSGSLLKDAQGIIEQARQEAYRSVNIAMLQRNWLLGKRISEEILRGENRAEYGREVIKKLSKELTVIYGKGFTKSYLYNFMRFYKTFPDIFQSPIGKSELLTWTHYMLLCTEGGEEQIELLQLDKSGIKVAKYMTELPPREVLMQQIKRSLEVSRELFDEKNNMRED